MGTQGLEQLLLVEMSQERRRSPAAGTQPKGPRSGQQGAPGEGQSLGHHQLGTLRLGERVTGAEGTAG